MKYGELDYLKGIIYFYMFLQSLFSWLLLAKFPSPPYSLLCPVLVVHLQTGSSRPECTDGAVRQRCRLFEVSGRHSVQS